jgi:hypothetical protein
MITATSDRTTEKRQGSVWNYVSASRLGIWAKCPLCFKIQYVDGIRTPTTPSLFLGKCVHGGLEHYYRHRQLGVSISSADAVQHVRDSWDQSVADERMKFADSKEETELQQQAADLVALYIDQLPPDEPRPLAVETIMEVPLVVPSSGEDLGISLLGIVDLVLDGEDGPTIIDFKTAARGGDLLEITHEVQLSCYAYGYRQLTGQVEGELQIRRLIKTKTPRIETDRYPARSDVHFRRLFALIRAYLDDLDAGRFVYRPGYGCGMCDFAGTHCQKWQG